MNNKQKLVICGAGGHARSVLDIALQNDNFEIVGCTDMSFPEVTEVPLMSDVSVIGTDEYLKEVFRQDVKHIFIAIGSNLLRKNLYNNALDIGFTPVNIISKHAVISPRAYLGNGICVMPGAIVNVNTIIGDNCIVNTNSSLDHDCIVGSHSHIAPGVTISGYVKIGEGVHIGTGSAVIDKTIIESGAFIGGGSTVVKNINNDMLAYGVPAKEIKKIRRNDE